MFNFFKKQKTQTKENNKDFEIELTASILAYEVARSDGDISNPELEMLLNEITKISAKVGKEKKKILSIKTDKNGYFKTLLS